MATSNVVILLIGLHGSGKSTFTKAVTGRADVEVSGCNGITETTRICKAYETKYQGTKFTIIDTPGLADQDTQEENLANLDKIASQLSSMGQVHVSGVIYFHDIQKQRLRGVDRANLRILRAICGRPFFPHVALLTTCWDCINPKFATEYNTILHDLEFERAKYLPNGPRTFKFNLDDKIPHKQVLDHFVTQVKSAAPSPLPELLFAEELKKYGYQHKNKKRMRAVKKTEAGIQIATETKESQLGFLASFWRWVSGD
ncbi:nucleolar GTP-binding protein 1 [Podospora conica]|nr:nucleolar GTP-binding protein 1 [Schizothecium conicum]